MLSVVFSGVITGLLYGLAGLGLVSVYRATKVMNFALGGMGALVAYSAKDMLLAGLPYWVVLPAGILVGALLGGLVELLVARPMRRQPHVAIGVATLGVLLIFEGIVDLRWGSITSVLPPLVESSATIDVAGVEIGIDRLVTAMICIVAIVALIYVADRTSFGLRMRAISSGPQTSALLGVNVPRVRNASWMIGGAFGGLAVLLVTPLTFLSPGSFTTFLLTAFAAVVLGGLTNFVGVVVGAVLFGVGINMMSVYVSGSLLATFTFAVVTVVLIFRPYGLFGKAEQEIGEPQLQRLTRGLRAATSTKSVAVIGTGSQARRSPVIKYSGWILALVGFGLVPLTLGTLNTNLIATILATFIGVLGLNVIAGFSGQFSLANGAFLAIGAYTTAYLVGIGAPLFVALAAAVAVGAVCGFLLGLPATRLSGIYLLLFTMMFAFALPEIILLIPDITGGASGKSLLVPGFSIKDDAARFYLALGAAAVAAIAVLIAAKTKIGRSWRAVRDSEAATQALGYSPARVRLGAFSFGSALVAFGGGISGVLIGYISPDSYGVFVAIYALLAVMLGGSGSVFGSLLGSAFIVLVSNFSVSRGNGVPAPLVMGFALVLVMVFAPGGLAPLLGRIWIRFVGIVTRRRVAVLAADSLLAGAVNDDQLVAVDTGTPAVNDREPAAAPSRDHPPLEAKPALLALESVRAGYEAGLVLDGFSMDIREGEIVALLGANGVGKSTVLRAISGLLPISGGRIAWKGKEMGGGRDARVDRIAHTGLGHVPEGRAIFPDLTVRENLQMGYFTRGGSTQPDEEWERIVEMFPILKKRLPQRAGSLSGGEQQMLAISRALIGKPRLLMLDEPSLGLAPVVSELVFDKLRAIVADGKVSVLLVEQNAHAALDLADRGYVIRRGEVFMSGSAAELRSDPRLSAAYLEVNS